jgi:AraC-like DNA-binding protein
MLGFIKESLSSESFKDISDSELLSRLFLYIHKNYNKKLSLSSISKAFGYHPAYISTYFKTCVNISIIRYINIVRLKNAVLLMQQSKYIVTQIAMDCGFSSTRTFYRVFRQEFGCSPKEYKENFC